MNTIDLSTKEASVLDLSSKYAKIANTWQGRMLTEDAQSELNKVADKYGMMFGVSREEACNQMAAMI